MPAFERTGFNSCVQNFSRSKLPTSGELPPQIGSFLCKSVILTGAQRSGGTCSCFSLPGRKFLNVRIADNRLTNLPAACQIYLKAR